ncbi:hypothetical protein M0804_014598 [Polistes exclamans]|nr:hypothetical protein M0804_014598 [Polistes exclamans]
MARLKKELKKRDAEKQSQGVKAVAAPNQGKQMLPTTSRATPALEKRLEDARVGNSMGCVMAVLRDFGKSLRALQKTQLQMWNIFKGTSNPPQRETEKTAAGGKGSATAPGTSRAPAPGVSTTKPADRQEKTTISGERPRRVGEVDKGVKGATGSGTKSKKKRKRKKKKSRSGGTRKTAAVSLVCNEAMSYRDALAKGRESISLKDIGIDNMTMMRGLTGAFVFSVRGKEAAVKADRVAEDLRRSVPEAKIARPQMTRSFRLEGIDQSLNMTIVRNALLTIKGNINPNRI